jgi:hypothetical protein
MSNVKTNQWNQKKIVCRRISYRDLGERNLKQNSPAQGQNIFYFARDLYPFSVAYRQMFVWKEKRNKNKVQLTYGT